ncbi:hypothetical protein CBS101457_005765 [Exobasidium rhododendri]|nr:hypothetical protein CBS101457_005765 [Exobasidium rhododendri]
MASRAHLLSGLRTGGPRFSTPMEGDESDQDQSSLHSDGGSPPAAALGSRGLKANAAPFTPGSLVSPPACRQYSGEDGQSATVRMQQVLAAAASQHQVSSPEGHQDFAALYGASQGQPQYQHQQQQQQQHQQQQQQEIALMVRQKQAQILQNQMLAHQQQQHMDLYRLQAASQQQQHLQQVAGQQRLLLAQMQAEYQQQQQEQAYSAQDQRMAARANLQASMRQRQAEQMYAQMMEQQQAQQGEDALVQQQQLLQQLQFLQLQAAAVTQMQGAQDQDELRRNGASPRSDSPSNAAAKEQMRRVRQASHTAANNATSWRSTSTSLPQREATPSIVVDESASEQSETGSAAGFGSDNETPDTSEENVIVFSGAPATVAGKTASRRLSGLAAERRLPSTPSAGTSSPKPLSLGQAPRTRAFTSEAKMALQANGSNTTSGVSRQPKGPPTEFHSINFTSRLSARTRREAMSKLCASPRVASFSNVSRSTVIA